MRSAASIFIGIFVLSFFQLFGQKTGNKLPEPLTKILNDTVKGAIITSIKQVPENLHPYMDTVFGTKDYPFGDNQKSSCADCGVYIKFLLIKENYVFVGYMTMGNSNHDYLYVFDLTGKQAILTRYDIVQPAKGPWNFFKDVQTLITLSTGNYFKKIQTIKL